MQFISYDGATEMSSDQEKGLDGIITEEDTKMLKYYSESLKFKSAHWLSSKINFLFFYLHSFALSFDELISVEYFCINIIGKIATFD